MCFAGATLKYWLCEFFSCLHRLKISTIRRRALVVPIPKSMKPVVDPKSYRWITLLCLSYKILKRLILDNVELIIDPLLHGKQAGFRGRKSTKNQAIRLTKNFENFLSICQSDSDIQHCLAL